MRGKVIELLPTEAADAAIVIRLNLKARRSEREGRKLRNRAGRQEGDHHPLAPHIETGNAGGTGEENVRIGGELGFAQDNLALREVSDLQSGYQTAFVAAGKPGERVQMAEKFQIGCACFVFIVQMYIYRTTLLRIYSLLK